MTQPKRLDGGVIALIPARFRLDFADMNESNLHVIEWLRKVQLEWELPLEQLARLCHCPVEVLEQHLARSPAEIESLPTVPAGLDAAVTLIGIFKNIRSTYPEPRDQNGWLQKENSVFEGHRPIDVMAMSPDHLAFVGYTVESGLRLTAKE